MQRPIPIWIGGSAEPPCAARPGSRTASSRTPARGRLARDLRAASASGWPEAGRDWSTFGLEPRIDVSDGTPDDWRHTADEWRALGATHLSLTTMGGGFEGAGGHIERLREAKEALT